MRYDCGGSGADAYAKGAKAIEEQEPQLAAEMYRKALDVLETEGKWAKSIDIFRGSVSLAIRQEDWDAAQSLLLRQGHACEKASAMTSQCRAYVGKQYFYLHCHTFSMVGLVMGFVPHQLLGIIFKEDICDPRLK